MFLADPPQTPAVRALYDQARAEDGYVMNLVRGWAWRPGVHEAFMKARTLLVDETSLSKREIAVLNTATATRRGDSYCAIAWGTRLAALSDAETAAALVRGGEAANLTEREAALVRWARLVTHDANAVTHADADALRGAGFTDGEVADATFFVAFRLAFTTVNAALGAQPDRRLADEAPAAVLDAVTFG
ncbi:MAG TPA: hypothetical protein VGN14_15520, partial [Candidatus Elarobacter sp.]